MEYNNSEIQIKEEFVEDQEMNSSGTSKHYVEEASLTDLFKANITPFRNHVIKSKILSGEYKVSMKKKRSKVWECFARILDENDEDIRDFVICRKCQNVYKCFQKSTSNLVRHKCFIKFTSDSACTEKVDVSADTKTEALQIFSQWIIENGRPYRITEDTGFQKVAEFLISVGAEYGKNLNLEEIVPRPPKLCSNIEELYETYFKYVKAEIKEIAAFGFALTSSIYTDSYLKKSYLAITIHYVQEGNIVVRLLGLESMEEIHCTGESILNRLRETLRNFGCSLTGNVTIVTGQTACLVNAFHTQKHIICISQLLKRVLQSAMDDDDDVIKLHGSCTKLIKYLKRSNFRASFCSTFERTTIEGYDLYYLFTVIKDNWTEIVQFLQERNNFGILSDISIAQITAMIKILQLFEEASKKLEAENDATMHFAYVYVHRLQKVCVIESTDSDLITKFKKKLSENLQSIIIPNISVFHKIALFLFPPTKKLILFSENEKEAIKNECTKIMRGYSQYGNGAIVVKKSSPAMISKKNFELFADFVQESKSPCMEDKAEKEIFQYESKNIPFFDDFNVVKWWDSQKDEFPLLYKLSCMVLATPATSSASEKVLLTAKNLVSEKRCHLSFDKDSISKIMFLNSNMEKFE